MEKYSVLMSLYIKETPEHLSAAIGSMLAQTVQPDEIVLVLDGPITSALQSVIDGFIEGRPHLFTIVDGKYNRGLGLALNLGLAHCRNELVARMDTDDISKPERCEKQLRAFEDDSRLDIVGAYVDEFVSDVGHVVSTRRVPTENKDIYEFAKRRSAFNHPVVMYRKSRVLENCGYADLRRNQDVDLFGRMLFFGCRATNLGESLLWFRADSGLARRRKSWENTKSYIATIKRFWKMGYASFMDYIVVSCAQTVMFIMPTSVQQWIYKSFLRK